MRILRVSSRAGRPCHSFKLHQYSRPGYVARAIMSQIRRVKLCALSSWLCFLATLSTVHASEIKTSEDLIHAMQKKYAQSWYKTLTFVQKTTEFEADGKTKVSTWYEALYAPGRLRIDFDPIADGNGILFANNTVYSMKGGKVENSRSFIR